VAWATEAAVAASGSRPRAAEAEDGELLAEGAGGAGEPVGRVVGAGVLHKADLEVQGGQGRGEVGVGGRGAEAAADPAHQGGAQRVVGDEEDPPLELAAGDGLGDIVEERREAQTFHAARGDAGAEAPQLELLLDAADDLQDVVKGVEVMVRAALEAPGQVKLGHRCEESGRVRGGFEGGEERLSPGHR
jgi:hypothetical protein